MRIIRTILFSLNVLMWVGIDVCLFLSTDWLYGLSGLAAVVAFFIGFSVSGGMAISLRDIYTLPEIGVFKKKIAYGNSWAFAALMILALVTHMHV